MIASGDRIREQSHRYVTASRLAMIPDPMIAVGNQSRVVPSFCLNLALLLIKISRAFDLSSCKIYEEEMDKHHLRCSHQSDITNI